MLSRYGLITGHLIGIIGMFLLYPTQLLSQSVSKSFELRYITKNKKANGITDFKGKTSIFSNSQRLSFLRHYADYGKTFFDDPKLNKKAVSDSVVAAMMDKLKAPPLPQVRKRKRLSNWKWIGYRKGAHGKQQKKLRGWQALPFAHIEQQALVFSEPGRVKRNFQVQRWRFSLQWNMRVPNGRASHLSLYNNMGEPALSVGIKSNGYPFYTSSGDTIELNAPRDNKRYAFKVEVDLKNHKYNVYVNNEQKSRFVDLQTPNTRQIQSFSVKGQKGTELGSIWGVGYFLTGQVDGPYYPETFIDQTFKVKPPMDRWNRRTYSDSLWSTTDLPKVYGSERHKKENLYLRKKVYVDGNYKRAVLNIETLDPGGQIWVNGTLVKLVSKRYPVKVNIAKYLHRNAMNLIAIKVNSFTSPDKNFWHPPQDPNIGWHTGRAWLDLTSDVHLSDVFTYAKSTASPAQMQANVTINNVDDVFKGSVHVKFYRWYPKAPASPATEDSFKVSLQDWEDREFDHTISVPDSKLWTPENPQLYKVEVILKNSDGRAIDDYVTTTGIRTVTQKGGTFRINGKPAMLNGAQTFGFRLPITKIATWARSAPKRKLVNEIAQIKRMNGNMMRIHNQEWGHNPVVSSFKDQPVADNINDPRLAELGDQLGIMFIWPTPAWTRSEAWGVDFKGYPKYIKQVRNHPSIAMWETSNHPFDGLSTLRSTNRFIKKVYQTIHPIDPSRLISPAASNKRFKYGNDKGTINQQGSPIIPTKYWTAPKITRGNMISLTGYGAEWSNLRKFPDKYNKSFLDSKKRAYFNFEHEESSGQPNWNLVKGKPWYQLHSYEWDYDVGSIGRKLNFSEWKESQAWQAFSGWEATKKQRMLGVDGFSWCSLHGGPNMATYKKPIIDYLGYAKLGWYTQKMIFQEPVAASSNVDVAYGPGDSITPVMMSMGGQRNVILVVDVYDMDHNLVQQKTYAGISLRRDRKVTRLDSFNPKVDNNGYYAIEYTIKKLK